MTAASQNYARKKKLPISKVTFDFKVLDYHDQDGCTERPEDGCIINGIFLEGCRWNDGGKCLDESLPQILYAPMPCMLLTPEVERLAPHGCAPWFAPLDEPGSATASAGRGTVDSPVYVCPLYKTLGRKGNITLTGHSTNFVLNVELPSGKMQHTHWVKRSVALFCASSD